MSNDQNQEFSNDNEEQEYSNDDFIKSPFSDESGNGSATSQRPSHKHRSSSSSESSRSSSGRSSSHHRRSSSSKSKSSSRKNSGSHLNYDSSSLKEQSLNLALLLVRVVTSIMMLVHGMQKYEMLATHRMNEFSIDPLGLGVSTTLTLGVFAEVICSIFLIVGLFTRFATFPLIITMLVATFLVNLDMGFAKMELSILYLLIYIFIITCGPGKYSLDRYIYKLKRDRFK